ncbi:restriction endonuclease subunit S [Pseudovibrio sp. Ad26]|uniref:restriction endonuclease subunit S n=1 Tax=Pseudovibrio sp. Ad26 TaxID=989410 RepID=UPI0007AEA6DE|nr:restriction endonuclease subunit S [Pseudovibrio sp. Ad26]KZL06186.1 Type I restriction modification DNA specificity domain protein [Pseudovibrio sp. Ad26]
MPDSNSTEKSFVFQAHTMDDRVKLGDFVKIFSGVSPSQVDLLETGSFPFVKVEDLNNCNKYQKDSRSYTNEKKGLVPAGAVLFPKRGAAIMNNKIRLALVDIVIDTNLMAILPDNRLLNEYLFYVIEYEGLHKIADTSTIPQLNNKHINPFRVYIPLITQQRKIAEILRTWDQTIETLEELRARKECFTTGVQQRFFESEYEAETSLSRAKNVFETVSERGKPDLPLLAVMQDIGIVRRDELDRRVTMPDGDISNYKVVRPGDFVISLRSFEGGLEYSDVLGLVSPAYTVLRPKVKIIDDYYRHFFKSKSFIGRLDRLVFGIRDGKQISFRDFGDMYIPSPSLEQQKGVAESLNLIEAELSIEQQRIDAISTQKRGLMQKLMTGEWRVKTDADEEAAA